VVRTLAQSLTGTIHLLGIKAGKRFDILISIGAFVAGLRLGCIYTRLILTTVLLFELLLHQELLLDTQTRTRAHLSLLFECELLLQLLRRSASGLALFDSWLLIYNAFILHLLGSCLYSKFHWLGHGGDMLQMRLATK